MEKTITMDGVDLRDFYGIEEANIRQVNRRFPQLKIIVRGYNIKVVGKEEDIFAYEKKISEILRYYEKYNHMSPSIVDKFFSESPLVPTISEPIDKDVIVYGVGGNIVKARTRNQQRMVEAFEKTDLLFAMGPAGSGKTYTAIALAVRALREKQIRRIILTRPAVEAGEKLGFLPGDLKDKLDPYLQPLYDALGDMIPSKKLTDYMAEGIVQIAPLAYMRGRTLDNACVILDEAQNTTREQLKMFLTRMGRNAKFIVTGDRTQIDLPNRRDSGLADTLNLLKSIPEVSIIELDKGDILRHKLVEKIVAAFEHHEKEEQTKMEG